MNEIQFQLKQCIIASLGARMLSEKQPSRDVLLDFGLSSTPFSELAISGKDWTAFTVTTRDVVLPIEVRDIVDKFIGEHGGSFDLKIKYVTSDFSAVTKIEHMSCLEWVWVRRTDNELNIAILNTQ